jgi:hypothetical protein
MILKTDYIDSIFEYPGLWDTPSKCGIKIIRNKNKTVVIATELYNENPGTSVTDSITSIATKICHEEALNPEKIIFIEHSPDMKSKMDFWNECFYRVHFKWEDGQFKDQTWEVLTKEQLNDLIKESV